MAVSKRSNHRCFYCGTDEPIWTYEHLIPVSRGGGNYKRNLVRACKPCNSRRGNDIKILKYITFYTPECAALATEAEEQMKHGRSDYGAWKSLQVKPKKIKASRLPCVTPLSEVFSACGPFPVGLSSP